MRASRETIAEARRLARLIQRPNAGPDTRDAAARELRWLARLAEGRFTPAPPRRVRRRARPVLGMNPAGYSVAEI